MMKRAPFPTWLVLLAVLTTVTTVLGGCRTATPTTTSGRPGTPCTQACGDYELTIVGSRSFPPSELLGAIEENLLDFERSDYGKAPIDDAAYLLEQLHRDSGFYRATVDYEVDAESKRVVLTVEEGPRVQLGDIDLQGVESIGRKNVRRLIAAQRSEDGWYSEARIERAAAAIASWYRTLGFLDARVEARDLVIEGNTARLALVVTEGQASRLGAVFFSGELVFSEEELARVVQPDIHRAYTPRRAARMLGVVETYHADRGYPEVEVVLNELEPGAEGAVNLALVIQPGPQVWLSEVRIEGAEQTRPTFIRARMTLAPGDLYSAHEQRESFRALYSSGLFSRIEMELEGEGPARALIVRVTEDWGRELFVEPGWGSYEQARIRAGIRDRNFLGTGRIARIEGLHSRRTTTAKMGLTDPWFLASGITADATLNYTRREEPSFEYEDTGLDLSLLKHWGRSDSASLAYIYRRSNLLSEDFNAVPVPGLFDDIGISSIRFGRLRDTRNQFVIPSAGHRTEFSFEWADELIGSELDFVRGAVSFAGYRALADRTVLAATVRTGLIQPTGTTSAIPLQERYFNGGESSVRSYAESQLGPKDSAGNPVGGETFSLFSVEVRQDLSRSFEAALFADAGNVALDVTDYIEFDNFGYALGVGLRYVLPIGPLRLDLGINPDPQAGDADYTLHFSVGRSY